MKIAENIIELADHANRFIDLDDDFVSRRVAYILVIHAMDEAGKLIRIMKKMVIAESDERAESISIDGFYSHPAKGAEAGTAGLLAVEWFEEVLDELAPAHERDGSPFDGYKAHLQVLRRDFKRERGRALYVDYEDGNWIPPGCADEHDIGLDAFILWITASFVKVNLEAGRTFGEISEIVQKLHASATRFAEAYFKDHG